MKFGFVFVEWGPFINDVFKNSVNFFRFARKLNYLDQYDSDQSHIAYTYGLGCYLCECHFADLFVVAYAGNTRLCKFGQRLLTRKIVLKNKKASTSQIKMPRTPFCIRKLLLSYFQAEFA